jgi:HAD superfamily hydrolase (TIGR01549 family)
MIKGIAFDLDGTLWNSVGLLSKAWAYALRTKGVMVGEEEVKGLVGLPSETIASRFFNDVTPELVSELKELRMNEAMKRMKSSMLFPETVEVLKELRNVGLKLAIATSLGRDLLMPVVKKFRLDELVDVYVSVEDVKRGKPFPDVFLRAFELLGVEPKEGMVVGDREYDIIPGREIGALDGIDS